MVLNLVWFGCDPVFLLSLPQAHALSSSTSVSPGNVDRRAVLSTVTGSLALLELSNRPKSASAATLDGQDRPQQPVVTVVGASGRTGALCVRACLERGIPVQALTRTGQWQPPEGFELDERHSSLLTVAVCDLKESHPALSIQGCQAVIYAASASKKGGSPQEIDNQAVVAVGQACLQAKVPRYVLISSTATTRPQSLGYIFTNVSVNGIMDAKRQGEQRVMEVYSAVEAPQESSYTIIRPGGLEEPKLNKVLGPTQLEVSQGDTLAGIVSRADLAEFSVELAFSSQGDRLKNTAVELYYASSVQPCEGRFKSQLKEGVRLRGDTYQELFSGIQPGIDFLQV